MKKILLPLIALVILFGGTSCSDFLDQPILGQNIDTPEYYNNEENARLALGACYHTLSYHTEYCVFRWVYGDIRSDDAEKGGGNPTDNIDMQYLKVWDVLATNTYCNAWSASYTGIYATNTFIERMKSVDLDKKIVDQYVAEAKFIRAFSYFLLVKYFGDVPLITQPVDLNNIKNIKREPFEAVLAQIEKDLTEAAAILPESYPVAEVGRITSGAAKALHARVTMYSIGFFKVKPESSWQEVYDLADEVIKSGMYALYPNYPEIFELEGENNSESVFELQFKTTKTGWGFDNQGNPGNVFVGTKGGNNDSWGWGFNCPTQDLADEFEAKDPRLYATIYGGEVAKYQYGKEEGVQKQDFNTGYTSRKLALDPVDRPTEHSDGPANVRIIRYSDILLMKAEAAFYLNKEAETRALINQVRDRARTSSYPKGFLKDQNVYSPTGFIGNLPDIPASVQGADLLKALKHERRVEFGIEGLRFWDLVRWGDYRDILPDEVKARFDKRQLRGVPVIPIPEAEVVSWGLEQNPS